MIFIIDERHILEVHWRFPSWVSMIAFFSYCLNFFAYFHFFGFKWFYVIFSRFHVILINWFQFFLNRFSPWTQRPNFLTNVFRIFFQFEIHYVLHIVSLFKILTVPHIFVLFYFYLVLSTFNTLHVSRALLLNLNIVKNA